MQNFKPLFQNIVWIVIFLLIIISATSKQLSWSKSHLGDLRMTKEVKALINEIKEKTEKDAVIASPLVEITKNVTGLTGRWSYLAHGFRTITSTSEQLDRICDILLVSKKEDRKNSQELIKFALGFQAFNEEAVRQAQLNLDDCLKREVNFPKYKMDYIVERDEVTGKLQIYSLKERLKK